MHDPVFAALLGFNRQPGGGHLTGGELARRVEATGRTTGLPYRWVIWQRRTPVPADSNHHVETVFDRPIDVPVPYEILGYHPGSFRATGRLVFRELNLGARTIAERPRAGVPAAAPVTIEAAQLYILEEGSLDLDIDGWLDTMAGGKLDDTRIAGLVVFRQAERWYGMALGYNRDGEPRSGTIDFSDDRILYPNPEPLKVVARDMRRRLERLAPSPRPARGDSRPAPGE